MAGFARLGFTIEALRVADDEPRGPDETALGEFRRRLDAAVSEFRPDVMLAAAWSDLVGDAFAKARADGIATVLALRDLDIRHPKPFAESDAVLVPSQYLADYYGEAFETRCTVLPTPLDPGAIGAVESVGAGYLVFIDPTAGHGAFVFARIADELGRTRPDVPLLVVEGEADEAALAACGLDLRARGNVHLMPPPPDRHRLWSVARIALFPALGWADRSATVAEALANGVPVIGSDQAGIPEALGGSGVVLPIPERLTSATRMLPKAEEIALWVEAILRLWDDARHHAEHRRRALTEASRWTPKVLGPRYLAFFEGVKGARRKTIEEVGKFDESSETSVMKSPPVSSRRAKSVVLVPHLIGIEWECEQGLQQLERAGVRVVRLGGSSAVDLARCILASDALHDGSESLLFIDADIGFEPRDALRLLARPEPVVAGIYVKKSQRELASLFAEGIDEVVFGRTADGLYPLLYAATGFLRIRAEVLRRMIDGLDLPLCNARWGRGLWPFFQPLTVPLDDAQMHYLAEDWAFSHRLGQIGVTPLADTSIRLWHYGRQGYGWEDAGADVTRYPSYIYRVEQ